MIDDKKQLTVDGRPRCFKSAEQLRRYIEEYFRIWEERNRPLTVIGMTSFLDVTRDTLNRYERGEYDDRENNFSDTIKKAKEYIECIKWEKALTGQYEKTVAIFDLKVNHRSIEYEKATKPTEPPIEESQEEEEDNGAVVNISELTDDELRALANAREILKGVKSTK